MMAYSIVFLFVYPIGCPLYFFVTLYYKRDAIKALDRTKAIPTKLRKYEFLFADYDSDYWHGETYRSIMRVVLSGLVVTFHRSPVVCIREALRLTCRLTGSFNNHLRSNWLIPAIGCTDGCFPPSLNLPGALLLGIITGVRVRGDHAGVPALPSCHQ